MVAAYRDVGNNFTVDNGLLKDGLNALQDFESVPRRWPLARLTVPLLKCEEHLDRVIAGCCWEVVITRKNPDESLGTLDNCPDPTSGDPMIVTWLASFARCPPPIPAYFPDMLTCLSPIAIPCLAFLLILSN